MSTEETTLRLKRIYRVPPEQLFRAWTDPELLRSWYAPVPGWVVTRADIDAREGGGYHIEFGPPDGEQIIERATYEQFDPPNRIVTVMVLQGRTSKEQTRTTIEFTATEGGTEVSIVEEGYSSAEVRDMHRTGWSRMLESLATLTTRVT